MSKPRRPKKRAKRLKRALSRVRNRNRRAWMLDQAYLSQRQRDQLELARLLLHMFRS